MPKTIEQICFKCGAKCCKRIILPLSVNIDKDQKRWIEYHKRLKVQFNTKTELYEIVINDTCSKLKNNQL